MFGKALCACGIHEWSPITPGTIHVVNDKLDIIGVTWAQLGTRACVREGCSATQTVVREGESGFEGTRVTRGWGCSDHGPAEVAQMKRYNHPVALKELATV